MPVGIRLSSLGPTLMHRTAYLVLNSKILCLSKKLPNENLCYLLSIRFYVNNGIKEQDFLEIPICNLNRYIIHLQS